MSQLAAKKKVLFSEAILQNPYPTYARLHEEGPLHYVEVANKWAVWSVFSHAECSSMAKDTRLSAKRAQQMLLPLPLSRQAEFKELARMLSLWLIFMDPPEHTRLRKLLNKGFSAAAVEALRPQADAIVNDMLKPLQPGSEIDLMSLFANPMPVRIISELMGIPQALHGTFVEASRAIAVFRGNPNRTVEEAHAAQNALMELTEFFRKTVADRRRNKGNDFISLLIDIEEEGEVLTEEELYAQCIALLFAGHETTRNLIGNGMYTLLQHPEETAELRDKPEIIRSTVEELLRFESPVQFTARVLKEEIELCGQLIPKGWTVLCMLGAANRDPETVSGSGSSELESTQQPTPCIQRRDPLLYRSTARTIGGPDCHFESGAAIPEDEARRPETRMGLYVRIPGSEDSAGHSVDIAG